MDDKEKVKQKIDIVDLITQYIPLKKAGHNFKAICPFHNEKSPSFMISAERQMWHCFGCGKGGDVFTFVMEYERIEFGEALKYLAEKAGVTLTRSAFQTEKESERNRLYSINHVAAQLYNYILLSHPLGKNALTYLTEKRKLPIELIKKFNLGFAPDSTTTLTTFLLKKKGFLEDELMLSGLASKKNGRLNDFFWRRIIFPLYDSRGNIIAFSGRVLNNDLPKYINNRETLIYKKGETLYGLFQAKEDIKKENMAIIVEGEFDVLSSFKEGVGNVIAVKGTALTLEQIKILKRFAEKITFCFDQDSAGIEAQRRSIELLEKESLVASVISPPKGKDLDELAREDPVLFKKTMKQLIPMYDFIIDAAISQYDTQSIEGKRNILDKTLSYLALIENEVIKEHYIRILAKKLDTSVDALTKQVMKVIIPKKTPVVPQVLEKKSREEKLELYFLALVIQSEKPLELLDESKKILASVILSTPAYNKLYQALTAYTSEPHFSMQTFPQTLPSELLLAFDTSSLFPLPTFSDNEEQFKELRAVATQIRELSIRNTLKHLSIQIKDLEKKGEDEKAENLKEEFSRFTGLLNK